MSAVKPYHTDTYISSPIYIDKYEKGRGGCPLSFCPKWLLNFTSCCFAGSVQTKTQVLACQLMLIEGMKQSKTMPCTAMGSRGGTVS